MRARIKPYNLQAGHLARSVTVMDLQAASFEAGRWYDLEALARSLRIPVQDVVDVLSAIRQDMVTRTGPAVFDIATPEDAAAIDRGELRVVAGVGAESTKPEVPKIDGDAAEGARKLHWVPTAPKEETLMEHAQTPAQVPATTPAVHVRPQPGRNRPGGR